MKPCAWCKTKAAKSSKHNYCSPECGRLAKNARCSDSSRHDACGPAKPILWDTEAERAKRLEKLIRERLPASVIARRLGYADGHIQHQAKVRGVKLLSVAEWDC